MYFQKFEFWSSLCYGAFKANYDIGKWAELTLIQKTLRITEDSLQPKESNYEFICLKTKHWNQESRLQMAPNHTKNLKSNFV